MIRLAAASEGNRCSFRHSSRKRPLNDPTKPFCCGLPGAMCNVMPLDAGVLAPGEHGMTGQFGAVVADHHARQPATVGDGGEFADDTPA